MAQRGVMKLGTLIQAAKTAAKRHRCAAAQKLLTRAARMAADEGMTRNESENLAWAAGWVGVYCLRTTHRARTSAPLPWRDSAMDWRHGPRVTRRRFGRK